MSSSDVGVVRRQAVPLIPLVIFAALFGACISPPPSTVGQGPPPGYIGGDIPSEYRGVSNPFGLEDERALESGRQLYQAHCAVCHGDDGRGQGPRWADLEPEPADFAAPPMLRAFREHQDYVFWWVSEGVAETPMPAFEVSLSEIERWQVIAYSWYLGEKASGNVSRRGIWRLGGQHNAIP